MIEANSLLDFFKKHSSKIAMVVLFLAIGTIMLGKKMDRKGNSEKADCLRAHVLFTQMQSGQCSKEALEEVTHIIERRPFLAPKYDPMICFGLLSQQKDEQVLAHMTQAMQRVKTGQRIKSLEEPVKQFNQITLLLAKKEYEQAATELKELARRLEKEDATSSLYACTLLRTLILAQKNKDLLLAKVTWDKLNVHPIWPEMASLFYENDLTLQDYLNQI